MGVEPLPNIRNAEAEAEAEAEAPIILGLQPAALIDHVARVDWSLLYQIPGERGGSTPVPFFLPLISLSLSLFICFMFTLFTLKCNSG